MAVDSANNKKAGVVVLAVLLGSVELVFVFSDPGPGMGWPLQVMIAAGLFFFSGAAIGYIHPEGWPIALLSAWGAVLLGGFIILMAMARYGREAFTAVEPPYISSGLMILFGSLGLTLFGSWLGKSLPRIDAAVK